MHLMKETTTTAVAAMKSNINGQLHVLQNKNTSLQLGFIFQCLFALNCLKASIFFEYNVTECTKLNCDKIHLNIFFSDLQQYNLISCQDKLQNCRIPALRANVHVG